MAGNDAHQNVSFFGLQLDPYPRAFKYVTTHVLAEDLTQEAILAAIKAGRCYVEFSEADADLLGAKYNANLRNSDPPGQSRVKVILRPVRVNAVDMRG